MNLCENVRTQCGPGYRECTVDLRVNLCENVRTQNVDLVIESVQLILE